jgi:hypothetical protein
MGTRIKPAAMGVIAAALAIASSAEADDTPPDVVVLRAPANRGGNGAGLMPAPDPVLGKVIELVPGDHVTVTLPEGTSRTIPWPQVQRVLIAKPVPVKGPAVRVHVASRRRVELQRRPIDDPEWRTACASPCDRELPLADVYRVIGDGASKEFRLRGRPGDVVDVEVHLPNTGGKITGGVLAGLGGLILTGASLVVLVGATSPSSCDGAGDIGPCGAEAASALDSGLLAAGVGAAALALGLAILHYSATTDVSQNGEDVRPLPERAPSPPDFPEPRVRMAFDPVPSSGGPATVGASSPTLAIPFLSGTF